MGQGTRQKVTHRITPLLGQTSGLNPEAVDKRSAREAYNFYLQNGILKKNPGSSLYLHSAYGSSSIPFLSFFQRRALWQLGQNLLIETAEGSQTEELLASDFDTNRLTSDLWQGNAYLANGRQLRFYDGTIVKDLGLLPPGNGKTPRQKFTAIAAGPGALPPGTYKYTITFYDSNTETESVPLGALVGDLGLFVASEYVEDLNNLGFLYSEAPILVGTQNVLISFSSDFINNIINEAESRVTHVRLYRAEDTGSGYGDYEFHSQYAIDSFPTSIIDETLTADLGEVALFEDKVPPPRRDGVTNAGADSNAEGARFVRFWRDSLFLFGVNFPEYTVTDTLPGGAFSQKVFPARSILYASDTSLPDYFLFTWEIGAGDDQEPTGVAVVGDVLCIFKERSIYTLVGTSLNNFVAKIQDEVRGCIAPGSLQETPFGAIFLSAAGVARFRGSGQSEIISNDILDEIEAINRSALEVIASSYDPDLEIYTIYVPSGTATENTRELKFSLKDAQWTVGERATRVASATVIPKISGPSVKLYGSASGGFLIDTTSRETVTDYPGQRYTAYWRSADFDFGSPEQQKRLTWLYVKARCSVNWIVDIAIYCNDGQSYVWELEDVDSESDIPYYASSQSDPDGAIYDESRYAGYQTEKRLKIPITGIGRDFFVEITEKTMNSDRYAFELLAVEVEAVLLNQ